MLDRIPASIIILYIDGGISSTLVGWRRIPAWLLACLNHPTSLWNSRLLATYITNVRIDLLCYIYCSGGLWKMQWQKKKKKRKISNSSHGYSSRYSSYTIAAAAAAREGAQNMTETWQLAELSWVAHSVGIWNLSEDQIWYLFHYPIYCTYVG